LLRVGREVLFSRRNGAVEFVIPQVIGDEVAALV
jgi:hypothetical protein